MPSRSAALAALICLVGPLHAQDQKAKAQTLVKEAVAFAKTSGKEALLKETNQAQGRFHVKSGGELYIFIYDMKGVCLGIGFQSQLIGMNRFNAKDNYWKFLLPGILETARSKGSGWVDYRYPNPVSNKVEAKTSYVEHLDGWVVGCGIYK